MPEPEEQPAEEMEIGATEGRTHEEVVASVVGEERAKKILARDEPGPAVEDVEKDAPRARPGE